MTFFELIMERQHQTGNGHSDIQQISAPRVAQDRRKHEGRHEIAERRADIQRVAMLHEPHARTTSRQDAVQQHVGALHHRDSDHGERQDCAGQTLPPHHHVHERVRRRHASRDDHERERRIQRAERDSARAVILKTGVFSHTNLNRIAEPAAPFPRSPSGPAFRLRTRAEETGRYRPDPGSPLTPPRPRHRCGRTNANRARRRFRFVVRAPSSPYRLAESIEHSNDERRTADKRGNCKLGVLFGFVRPPTDISPTSPRPPLHAIPNDAPNAIQWIRSKRVPQQQFANMDDAIGFFHQIRSTVTRRRRMMSDTAQYASRRASSGKQSSASARRAPLADVS
nr:MAG TPA: hypothetical protein [Caudoviricetes sp.]